MKLSNEISLFSLTPRVLWSPPDAVRDRPILGALLGERAALIVETGASPAHASQFRSALVETGAPAPRFAALTHWHWDHVFGTAEWGLPTIGHVETRQRVLGMARLDWRDAALDARVAEGKEFSSIADHVKVELTNAERARLVIAPPDLTFTDQLEVDLDGLTVQVIHVGGDHSPDSSVIFTPEERVVFLGDCLYDGHIGVDYLYTRSRLLPLLDRLEALPADYYLLAHEPAPFSRAEFLRDALRLRRIAGLVTLTGPDREAALARLPGVLGGPADEDSVAVLDSFLRGLAPDVAEGA